jgi:hypothetical protein
VIEFHGHGHGSLLQLVILQAEGIETFGNHAAEQCQSELLYA